LHIKGLLHAALSTWQHLATTAPQHPMPIESVVLQQPTCIAATDASKAGLGGVFLTDTTNGIWHLPLLPDIQSAIVSDTGSGLAAQHRTIPHPHVLIASDNTATVSWIQRGSTTFNTAPAFLLHYLAPQCRALHYDVTACFTCGTSNTTTDFCSRFFSLNEANFLAVAQSSFPIQNYWQHVAPPTLLISNVNSAVLRKLLPLELLPCAPPPTPQHGTSGQNFASTSILTHNLQQSQTPYRSYKYLQTDTEMCLGSQPCSSAL